MRITGELQDVTFHRVGRKRVAHGVVYGDTKGRFPDGYEIWTSYIRKIDCDRGLIITRNSVYRFTVLSAKPFKGTSRASKSVESPALATHSQQHQSGDLVNISGESTT